MDKISLSPKNLPGLMSRLEEKRSQDVAEQMALTSSALQKLEQNLQTQSLAVLDSTSRTLALTSQSLETSVSTSLQSIATATSASTEAMADVIAQSQQHLQDTMVRQTKALAKSMRDTVQAPTTDLAATVKQAGSVTTDLAATVETTRMMLKMIVLATLGVCLASCFGIWVFWKWMEPWSVVEYSNSQVFKVLEPGWAMCQIEGKPRPCRSVE